MRTQPICTTTQVKYRSIEQFLDVSEFNSILKEYQQLCEKLDREEISISEYDFKERELRNAFALLVSKDENEFVNEPQTFWDDETYDVGNIGYATIDENELRECCEIVDHESEAYGGGLTAAEYGYMYGSAETIEEIIELERSGERFAEPDIPERYRETYRPEQLERIKQQMRALVEAGDYGEEYARLYKLYLFFTEKPSVPPRELQVSRFKFSRAKLEQMHIHPQAILKSSSDYKGQLPYIACMEEALRISASIVAERFEKGNYFLEVDDTIGAAVASMLAPKFERWVDERFKKFVKRKPKTSKK